jgi:hypothetical protein
MLRVVDKGNFELMSGTLSDARNRRGIESRHCGAG